MEVRSVVLKFTLGTRTTYLRAIEVFCDCGESCVVQDGKITTRREMVTSRLERERRELNRYTRSCRGKTIAQNMVALLEAGLREMDLLEMDKVRAMRE